MSHKSIIHRFFHNVLWNLLGAVGARLLAFLAALIAARLLGKERFGELGIIQSTIGLMGTFAGFGLGLTTTKYIAEWKGKDPLRTGRIIALANLVALITGAVMTLACILAAPWLARETLNAPHLASLLQLGSMLLLVSALLGVQNGSLAGFQAFRSIARINVIQGLVTVPLTILLVYWFGLLGAVLSLIFSALVGVCLSSLALRKECAAGAIRLDYAGCWGERRSLWEFSLPALLAGSLVTPVTWAANAILVNQPNGYAQMGLFNAANQFRMLIFFLPNIIGMVTVPLLSEIHGQDDPAYFARAVNANLRTIWGLAIPLGFFVVGFSSWLIGLYGPEFQGGRTVLALMACVTIMYVAGSTVGQALIGAGKMWTGFLMNLGWALIFLPLVAHWTPSLGATGLAQAYFVSYACFTIALLIYIGVKFGRTGVQYSPHLVLVTCLVFTLALSIGRVSESFITTISILLGITTAVWGWRLLPQEMKQRIIGLVPFSLMSS